MSHLRDAIGLVVSAAQAAGIRVTADPRSLNPPAVIVEAESATRRTRDSARVELTARLVAPGPANLDAMYALDDLVAAFTPALDAVGMSWTAARLAPYEHPGTGETLHSYELSVSTTVGV